MSSAPESSVHGGQTPSPFFVLLFDALPRFDAAGLTAGIRGAEPLKQDVTINLDAESADGFVAYVYFDDHHVQLVGLSAPAPADVLKQTVLVSRYKREVTQPMLGHRAQIVCYYCGTNPDPGERLIALQKIARSYLGNGLLGLLDPEAWTCMPRSIVEKVTLLMLRSVMMQEPLSFWIGFVKMPQERGVWFCTKGQHRFGFPDMAYRGEMNNAKDAYDLFQRFFLQMRERNFVPKPGDTAQIRPNEYIVLRELYELQEYLDAPLGTLVIEKTSEAEARTGGPGGRGTLFENKDKAVFFKPNEAQGVAAATAFARETLPHFWQVFDKPAHGESRFSLKVRVTDKYGTEHFWVEPIERQGENIFGQISNDPNIVKTVKRGDRVPVPDADITDWLYFRDGKMVGNYTARVLVRTMPPAEAEKYTRTMSNFTPFKIQCACGQRISFEVEVTGGGMPFALKCPSCGADNTADANAILARVFDTQAPAPPAITSRPATPANKPLPPPAQSAKGGARQMNPGLQIALVVLIALALLVPLALGIMGKLKARPGASRPPISETPVNPERQTAEPAATPDVGRSTTPAPEPVTSSTPTPAPAAPLAAIDLGGKLMTFTNLHGKTFENVKLVKADPRAGLIYSFDGGEGSVAFNNLSLEFLDQIGVPTNWPGVMPGRPGGPAPARAPGTFVVGDHVVVRWGGKWEPATIVAFQNFNIVVHITDPASHVANNLYVPTNWVQLSH